MLLIVPPATCTAQGSVCPETVTCQLPVLLVVVVSALPAAQLTLMIPLTIGKPTAAEPPKVLAVVPTPPPSPPPQPVSNRPILATVTIDLNSPKLNFMIYPFSIDKFLHCEKTKPSPSYVSECSGRKSM